MTDSSPFPPDLPELRIIALFRPLDCVASCLVSN